MQTSSPIPGDSAAEMRDRFEAWISAYDWPLSRNGSEYRTEIVQGAWRGWQAAEARLAPLQKEIERLKGENAELLRPFAEACNKADVRWAPDEAVVTVKLTYGSLRRARAAHGGQP